MYGILAHKSFMLEYLEIKVWFILSSIIMPVGYVLQDVVADVNDVEDVEPNFKNKHKKINKRATKKEHTIVQLYGRFAIILGSLIVGLVNFLFLEMWMQTILISIYFMEKFIYVH